MRARNSRWRNDRFVGAACGLRNHNFGLAEIEMGQRQPQDLAAGRVLAREQVERGISAELDRDNAVFEARELSPVAVGIHEVVGELAAIAVADGGEQPAAVVAGMKLSFCDARKIFPEDVGVLRGIAAQLVKVNLLKEVGVFGGTLIALRIAGVIKAGAVGLPGDAAAGGGEVDAGNDVAKLLAGSDFKHMCSGVFRAVLGERGRNVFTAERRHDRNPRRAIPWRGGVGIEDDASAGRVVGRAHHDQQRLLQRRLVFFGEQHAGAKLQI